MGSQMGLEQVPLEIGGTRLVHENRRLSSGRSENHTSHRSEYASRLTTANLKKRTGEGKGNKAWRTWSYWHRGALKVRGQIPPVSGTGNGEERNGKIAAGGEIHRRAANSSERTGTPFAGQQHCYTSGWGEGTRKWCMTRKSWRGEEASGRENEMLLV